MDLKGVRFVVPCVLSPTGWVRRKLTGTEMCHVLDIPVEVTNSLTLSEVIAVCKEPVLHLKIATKVIATAMAYTSSTRQAMVDRDRDSIKRCKVDVSAECSGEVLSSVGLSNDAKLDRKLRAVKSDDATVPEYLWDLVLVLDGDKGKIGRLFHLRHFILRWLKRRFRREFVNWFYGKYHALSKRLLGKSTSSYTEWSKTLRNYLRKSPEAAVDWEAGAECVRRYSGADWWEWTNGSRPHYWRWPQEYQKQIRDGVPPWLKSAIPKWLVPQQVERVVQVWEAMKKKLDKVRRLGYIGPGKVESLTSFFSVPKGENDIRMVYDGTKSGLNDAMWAPWFALPTVESHLWFVTRDSYLGNMDIGDMFHNFVLHEKVQELAGIDLTTFYPSELSQGVRTLWERWRRCAMGLRSSPYNTIQGVLFGEEVIRGDPMSPENIFRWDEVLLNLPGSPTYKPHIAWVRKMRKDGKVACDFITYVDDTRSCGNS